MNKKHPKPLKVGLVFDDTLDSSDGVAQHVKTLGAWLTSQGHEVCYLVGETKIKQWAGGEVYSLARNQKVAFNGNKLSIPRPANKQRIKTVLDTKGFDVLHVMLPYSPFMAQRIINLAGPQTAVVGTFHIYPAGFLSRFGTRLLRVLYGDSLSKFSRIVSVSPAAAAFAKASLGIDTDVIPNPIQLKKFKKIVSKKSSVDKKIVFLGRLVERKGCKQLIQAFAGLIQQMPDVELVIAGDGPQRPALEKLSRNLGIKDKVKFLGFIDEADKPALLATAQIACFPSLYGESFGIVLIEAMAAGAEVVLGGDNPGYRSVLGKQPELLVNPSDIKGFTARLHHLLSDNKLRSDLSVWQQSVVRQYDIGVVGERIEQVYDQAIARSVKKSHNESHE